MTNQLISLTKYIRACSLLFIFTLIGCGTVGGGGSTTYVPTWITASWSGGAVGPPNDRTDIEAEDFIGQMCPANSLSLQNYTEEFAGLHLINSCTITISYAACVSKGSLPQPENGLKQCATDPLETPMDQLTFKALNPGNLGDFINTTEILSINIFFCSDEQNLCAAPLCDSVQCL